MVATASVHPHITVSRPERANRHGYARFCVIRYQLAILVQVSDKHHAANLYGWRELQPVIKAPAYMYLARLKRCGNGVSLLPGG